MQDAVSKATATVVLVVEDEGLIRMVLAGDLEDAGFIVIEAKDADAAMATLSRRSDIDVVVTDVRMPGSVDGIGLAAWMREHVPAVPIIIATAFAELPDVAEINPAIARVVAKPYNSHDVAEYVTEVSRAATRPH